jgi:hypothetical protein
MNKFNFSFKNRFFKSSLELLMVGLIGFFLPFWIAKIEQTNISHRYLLSPVTAQTLSPEVVANEVYEQIPDFPKANNYKSKETGELNPTHTLISRMVRYHQYIKGRPTAFRLDWKLTLADYLGANEIIKESRYPGYNTLTENPLPQDLKIVDSLTFTQRQNLVDALVNIYNPQNQNDSSNNSSDETNTPDEENNISPPFELPQPGGAELLMP